jgi:MFS family permease
VDARGAAVAVKKNIALLYGFSFFDQFMIVIALWVPYLATQGIGMRQFMELQAVFAIVILSGEVPSGLLSDLWGRKKTLLLGSTLKAASFSLLPLWSSYEGFLFYHLTMGIALSMISGGDVALLYDSYLAADGEKPRGAGVLGNAKFAAQTGTAVSALLGGAVVTLSYGHLLWANAILSWIPVLLVLCITEPPASFERPKKWAQGLEEALSATLVRDTATRLVFLNLVVWGSGALVGSTVRLVGARNPVFDRLRMPAPAAGPSRDGSEPGSRTAASVMVEEPRPPVSDDGWVRA